MVFRIRHLAVFVLSAVAIVAGDLSFLRAQPEAPPPADGRDRPVLPRGQLLGIRTGVVTDEMRVRMRLPKAAGARVVSRVVGSPAERAGIPLEAVIVAVDDQPVTSPVDLARLIDAAGPGKEVELAFYHGGEQHTLRVPLANVARQPQIDEGPLADPRAAARPFGRPPPPPDGAAERIEQLERRIRELEQRVNELERALKAFRPPPAAER